MGGAPAIGFAWGRRRWLPWLGFGTVAMLFAPVLLGALIVGGVPGTQSGSGVGRFTPSAFALRDIPPLYLRTYQSAAGDVGGSWEYLAAIGKIETDHGRSSAPGVRSGVNFAGCCAGPMQFSIRPRPSTWDAYGGGGSVYDPADAIPAAARYLKASGAPADWDRAIFSYNHASWYVAQVKAMAERYRGAAAGVGGLPAGSGVSIGPLAGHWLVPVPGTSAVCDARIVPDLVMLMRRYRMTPGDCYAASGHEAGGEHPLGLGVDLVPAASGSWTLLGKLATDLGWRAGCAASGCAGQLPSPMRFIGWNGYQGHGDPQHAGSNAHLHLSWQHTPAGPGSPAARVQTLLAP